ncbi:hypothetical protein RU87_GL001058 [Lactococcus plantarum]|uniref:Uncharacterized protein n=1 Tax=Pseudolactococcus plantarum TaxID=1365 RepID=A0A2A5S1V2_9LACT|nr:hypothetical protein RU87_GL001058 [Lactococcus plantarum]
MLSTTFAFGETNKPHMTNKQAGSSKPINTFNGKAKRRP